MGTILLYAVGIYFRKEIHFVSNANVDGVDYMYGSFILQDAAAKGLRYQVSTTRGHLEYVSYTPQVGDTFAHFPGIDAATPQPAPVPPTAHKPAPRAFPYYGQPLSLFENPQPIGQISQILQYTATPKPKHPDNFPIEYKGKRTTTADPANPEFYFTGFADNTEIRIRAVSIYVSQAPGY
jgi:hypothetical protein